MLATKAEKRFPIILKAQQGIVAVCTIRERFPRVERHIAFTKGCHACFDVIGVGKRLYLLHVITHYNLYVTHNISTDRVDLKRIPVNSNSYGENTAESSSTKKFGIAIKTGLICD